MSNKIGALDITIMGRTYKVACADEERESLLQAVAYLDQKMNEIKATGRIGSAERIAVMAALNITHELLTLQAAQTSVNGFDIEGVKRRIASMRAALDEALAPQENLF
ncbi:MAG: cell division protein ZapA [Burkholderiales bacterium]|nr:cell division protein ZapA [Burkholderiales bacterium]